MVFGWSRASIGTAKVSAAPRPSRVKRVPRRSLTGPPLMAASMRRMGQVREALAPKTMRSPLLLGSVAGLVLFDRTIRGLLFHGRGAGVLRNWCEHLT